MGRAMRFLIKRVGPAQQRAPRRPGKRDDCANPTLPYRVIIAGMPLSHYSLIGARAARLAFILAINDVGALNSRAAAFFDVSVVKAVVEVAVAPHKAAARDYRRIYDSGRIVTRPCKNKRDWSKCGAVAGFARVSASTPYAPRMHPVRAAVRPISTIAR